ncbi:hypothetical protein [Mycobacterium sp. PSTR-4-N]|uniref:hypothetical protein n=1 Tax=Mycobacterium sp. PSTR-4-N TaxID=2917745 RepID=UPI001F14FE2B|nr:hypothetical protein [Mycobacterium sp. PSTR-4-N]MCG7595434.1 hypothetical protein [Mycobacterium sp. PSTR-4-N]
MSSGPIVAPRPAIDGADPTTHPPGDPTRRRSRALTAVIFSIAFGVYALLPTRNFNYADDSLSWAYQLTQPSGLINSHHLYLNGMRVLYRLLHDIGITVNPVELLSLYSALWGAIGLAVLFCLLGRAGLGPQALWGTLFCAFSAGYWSYSIVGDVYVPAIALMVIGFFCTYCGLTAQNPRRTAQYAVGAIVAFTAMILHHQAFAMVVVGLIPAALLMKHTGVRRRLAYAAVLPISVGLLTSASYLFAYASLPATQQHGIVRFGAGYVESFDPRADQKQLNLASAANMAVGQTRALVSTNVVFRSPAVAEAVAHRYPYRATYPFPYLVRNISPPAAIAIGVSAALAAVLTACLVVAGLWVGLKERGLILLVSLPMIPQALFFGWWEGISDEFALWTLPLLAIIVTRGAAQLTRPARWLGVTVTCLFVSTLAGSTSLYWNADNDIDFVNDRYVHSLGGNDVLIGFEDIQSDFRIKLEAQQRGFRYLNYFNVRNPEQNSAFDAALQRSIASHANIYVSPRLSYPPQSAVVFKQSTEPQFETGRRDLLTTLHRISGIHWLKPTVFSAKYFHVDPGAPAPN